MDSPKLGRKDEELDGRQEAQAAAAWLLKDLRQGARAQLPSPEMIVADVARAKAAIEEGAFSPEKTRQLVEIAKNLGRRLNRHTALKKLGLLAETNVPTLRVDLRATGSEIRAQFAAGKTDSMEHNLPKKFAERVDGAVKKASGRWGYDLGVPDNAPPDNTKFNYILPLGIEKLKLG